MQRLIVGACNQDAVHKVNEKGDYNPVDYMKSCCFLAPFTSEVDKMHNYYCCVLFLFEGSFAGLLISILSSLYLYFTSYHVILWTFVNNR